MFPCLVGESRVTQRNLDLSVKSRNFCLVEISYIFIPQKICKGLTQFIYLAPKKALMHARKNQTF